MKHVVVNVNKVKGNDQSVAETSKGNVDQSLKMRCPEMNRNDLSVARFSDDNVAGAPQPKMCLAVIGEQKFVETVQKL